MDRALRRTLESIASAGLPRGGLTVLDVGGRGRPYAALLASILGGAARCLRHIVLDPDPGADIVSRAEELPVASSRADLVISTQVLEHVQDPARAVGEMARVLKSGGWCVLTTHGTWFYHPDPEDYWRWTPAGLTDLFVSAGFGRVDVRPVGGTKLALLVLLLTAAERAAGEGARGSLFRRLVVAPANLLGSRWLLGRVTDRVSVPGELAINYLVTARR